MWENPPQHPLHMPMFLPHTGEETHQMPAATDLNVYRVTEAIGLQPVQKLECNGLGFVYFS